MANEQKWVDVFVTDRGRLEFPNTDIHNPHVCGIPANMPGFDSYASGSGLRGDAIAIPLEFESGHRGVLWLGQHKGDLYLRLNIVREPLPDVVQVDEAGGRRS